MLLNLDYCADIVSEQRFESVVSSIFKQPIGTWCPLDKVLKLSDFHYENSVIFVSWSHSLHDEDNFSLIVFCEEESMNILTSNYNINYLYNKTDV